MNSSSAIFLGIVTKLYNLKGFRLKLFHRCYKNCDVKDLKEIQ